MAVRQWTPEQRQRQAALIRTWSPWENATGPTSQQGKQVSAQNAFKGGLRSELRKINQQINAILREQRDLLNSIDSPTIDISVEDSL